MVSSVRIRLSLGKLSFSSCTSIVTEQEENFPAPELESSLSGGDQSAYVVVVEPLQIISCKTDER